MTLRVTQCPACESTFNTSPSLLESAAGRVRCGACLTVFDARENFIDSEPNPADSGHESVFVSQSPEQFFDPSRFLTRQSLRDALAEQSETDLSGDSFKLTGEEIQPESSAVATSPAPEQTSAFIDAAGQSATDNSEAGEIYIAEESDFMALVAAGVDESDEALIEPDFTDEPASPDPIAADNAAPESAPIEPEPCEAERGRDNLNAAELAGLTDPAELAESEALDEPVEPGGPDERDAQDQEYEDEFAESPEQESPLLATAAPESSEDLPTEAEARDDLTVSEAPGLAEEPEPEAEQESEKDSEQVSDELPEAALQPPAANTDAEITDSDNDTSAESMPPASPTAPFSDSFTSSFADSFADEQRPEHLRLHARFTIETPLFAAPEPLSDTIGASGEAPGQTSSDEVSTEPGLAVPADSSASGNDETRDTAALEEEFNAALEEEDFQQALLDSYWQEEQPDVELPEADSAEVARIEPDGDGAETWQQTPEPAPEGEAEDLPGAVAWPPGQSETANLDKDESENLADSHPESDDMGAWQGGGFDAANGLDTEPQAQTEADLNEAVEADQFETGITAAEESDAVSSEVEQAATEFAETESAEVTASRVESAEPGNSEIESSEIESTEAKSTEVKSTEEDSSDAPARPETEASTTEDNAEEAPQPESEADPQQESPEQSLAAIRARALQAELEDDEALEAIPEENLKVLGEFSTPVEILEGRRRQLGRRLGWTLLALLAALGLASQYLWQELPRYSQQTSLRPVYEWACSLSGCELPVYSQIDAIQSSNLSVRSHPQRSDALAVNVEFRNNADFPQEFPVMVLSFNSASNSVIALREFAPQEYLDEALQNRRLLPPATPVQVALEIMDPGDDAVNYTLAFRRP